MKKHLLILTLFFASSAAFAANVKMGKCDSEACVAYFKEYKKYARDHIDAAAMLGDMYLNGYGTEIDKDQALRYYTKAAVWGSVLGRFKMGLLQITSDDIEERQEGIDDLIEAAKRDHPGAIYFMGEVLSNDKYGMTDYERADKWLSESVQNQNKNVVRTLARLSDEQVLTADNFPQTVHAISRAPDSMFPGDNQKQPEQIRMPEKDDRYEVITVNGPNMEEVLDYGITLFQAMPGDIFKRTTGTRIRGRDCDDLFSCSSVHKADFQRHLAQNWTSTSQAMMGF